MDSTPFSWNKFVKNAPEENSDYSLNNRVKYAAIQLRPFEIRTFIVEMAKM